MTRTMWSAKRDADGVAVNCVVRVQPAPTTEQHPPLRHVLYFPIWKPTSEAPGGPKQATLGGFWPVRTQNSNIPDRECWLDAIQLAPPPRCTLTSAMTRTMRCAQRRANGVAVNRAVRRHRLVYSRTRLIYGAQPPRFPSYSQVLMWLLAPTTILMVQLRFIGTTCVVVVVP